ncbi:MAG: hypothetical protein EGQ56_00050 [Clostridiales bacterium]|nr:hypothetical protein [Clostridiales bacterium]
MRKVPVFLLAISLAALLAGCAGQAVPLRGAAQLGALSAAAVTSEAVSDEKQNAPALADAPNEENPADLARDTKPQEDTRQPESKADASESPVPAGEEQPDAPEQPITSEQPVMPTPAPTPAEKQEEEPAPASEPAPTPKPIASGDIYSIAEAIQAGNEYARAQYGVTIDTSMTAADSSYFPGTADSVAWLAENGGQAALTAAVKGNVDATFACLAAMDGAETVSAYARFNCTARYDAASDEYIVVVLYG